MKEHARQLGRGQRGADEPPPREQPAVARHRAAALDRLGERGARARDGDAIGGAQHHRLGAVSACCRHHDVTGLGALQA